MIEVFETCTVEAEPRPAAAAPGELVALVGGPFGEPWDNAVQLDGVAARVLEVDRAERVGADGEVRLPGACERCDACRDRNLGHCNRCRETCYECVETLTFEVPAAPVGATTVVVLNGWGGSGRVPFTVLGGATTTGTPSGTPTGTPTGAPTGTPTGAPTGTPSGTASGTTSGTPTGTPTGTGTTTGAPTGTPAGTTTTTGITTGAATGTATGTATSGGTPTGTATSTGVATGSTSTPGGSGP